MAAIIDEMAAAAKAVGVIALQNQDVPWGDDEVAGWQFHSLRLAEAAGDSSLVRSLVHAHAALQQEVSWDRRTPSARAGRIRALFWADPAPDPDHWTRDVAWVLDHAPLPGIDAGTYPKNSLSFAYFGTMLLRPLGGDAWTKWWSPLRARLAKTQGGDGAWPAGFDPGMNQAAATALATLILEIPRRIPALPE